MRIRVWRVIGYGLTGLLIVPVAVMFSVLGLAHLFDPSCGTAGDSGGCEMGSFSVGAASALPAMVIGIVIALWRDWRAASGGGGDGNGGK